MLPDLKKSIDRILHDRLTSPFWGAFMLSWLIWNWRIPYVSIFVDQDKLPGTRIDYIVSAINWKDAGLWPFLSAIGIILIAPLLTNGAYWVYIRYEQWKVEQKSQVDKKRRLTIEESVKLKSMLHQQEEDFDQRLNKKESQIQLLQSQIVELQNEASTDKEAFLEKDEKIKELERISSERREKIDELLDKLQAYQNSETEKIMLRNELSKSQEELRIIKGDVYTQELKDLTQTLLNISSKEEIDDVLYKILSGDGISNAVEVAKLMNKYDFIDIASRDRGRTWYKFTSLGEVFRSYFYKRVLNNQS